MKPDTSTTETGFRMNGHEVALWSAVAAFFGYLIATGIFDLVDTAVWTTYLGAFIVAAITAGAVYSKERLSAAKREEKASAPRKRGA